MESDWLALRQLARDLKHANWEELKVAAKYPDVFHRNVVRSRQEEICVYATVNLLITKHLKQQAQAAGR